MSQRGNIAIYIIGIVVIIAIIGGIWFIGQSRKIIKAVPDTGNRVIFITPRPTPTDEVIPTKEASPSARPTEEATAAPTKKADTVTVAPTAKPTTKPTTVTPTVKPSVTVTVSPVASPSASQ